MKLWITYVLLVLLLGCTQVAWKEFKIATPPDSSCVTGGASGYNIYKWECLNNERVVVYQVSSEMGRGKAKMEKSTCGNKTKFEKMIEESPKHKKCTYEAAKWNSGN